MKKFPNLRKSSIMVFAMFLSIVAFSQLTRQQAINLVMNTIVGADSSMVIVYAAYDSHTQEQAVILFDERTVNCPYSANWIFFINDDPYALWHHPCRFVFVNGENGDYTVVNESLYPVDLYTAYELISSVPGNGQITFPDYTGVELVQDDPNDHLFAVLVGQCGGVWNEWQWYDISLIYSTLLEKALERRIFLSTLAMLTVTMDLRDN